jgi:signal transduction histidine kinase
MRRWHWIVLDFPLAGALGASAVAYGLQHHSGAWDYLILYGVALVTLLGTLFRRLRPLAAFWALAAATMISVVRMPGLAAFPLGAMVYVLYSVAVGSRVRASATALAGGFLLTVVPWATRDNIYGNATFWVAFGLVIFWLTGYSVRQRRAYATNLQAQAASSAVAEERLRIARELHDVVAHSMSVIAVQAGFGQYVIDNSPAAAREALGAIQATSRDALEELRRMLGILRQQPAAAGDAAAGGPAPAIAAGASGPGGMAAPGPQALEGIGAVLPGRGPLRAVARRGQRNPDHGDARRQAAGSVPLAPAPGLRDLERLAQRTRGAGVTVGLARSGAVRELPAGVELSAYRIIQEALTNVVRHAGHGARVMVVTGYEQEALTVEVTDDGGNGHAMHRSPGGGHGLIGMRERARLCGGDLSAERHGRGFQVLARLPVPAASSPLASATPESNASQESGAATENSASQENSAAPEGLAIAATLPAAEVAVGAPARLAAWRAADAEVAVSPPPLPGWAQAPERAP